MRSVQMDAGAGGLRADIRSGFEMEDAGVYERRLADAQLRPLIAQKTLLPGIWPQPARHVCGK